MRKKIFFITLLLCSLNFILAQQIFRHGDLLFQQLNCGDFCEAINIVTPAYQGKHYNHVGIVTRTDSGLYVLEAISKGVVLTTMDSFLRRTDKENMLLARVPKKFIFRSSDIRKFLGKPYDNIFDLNNDAYYCSELAYFLYKTKKGKHFFSLHPMTFKDPASGNYHPLWARYFAELHVSIPENQPGLNPGSMLQEKRLKTKHFFQ